MSQKGGPRAASIGKEELKDLVKKHMSVIERFQMQGDLEEFMKNNISFLQPLARHTARVPVKLLQTVIMEQKPHLNSDECRRYSGEVGAVFGHVLQRHRNAVSGEKLSPHVGLLGEAMGLQCGKAPSPSPPLSRPGRGGARGSTESLDLTSDDSQHVLPVQAAASSGIPSRLPAAAASRRHEVIKQFLGWSPPPAKKAAASPLLRAQKQGPQEREEQPRREVVSSCGPLSVASSDEEEPAKEEPAPAPAKEERVPKTKKNQGKEKSSKRKTQKVKKNQTETNATGKTNSNRNKITNACNTSGNIWRGEARPLPEGSRLNPRRSL